MVLKCSRSVVLPGHSSTHIEQGHRIATWSNGVTQLKGTSGSLQSNLPVDVLAVRSDWVALGFSSHLKISMDKDNTILVSYYLTVISVISCFVRSSRTISFNSHMLFYSLPLCSTVKSLSGISSFSCVSTAGLPLGSLKPSLLQLE